MVPTLRVPSCMYVPHALFPGPPARTVAVPRRGRCAARSVPRRTPRPGKRSTRPALSHYHRAQRPTLPRPGQSPARGRVGLMSRRGPRCPEVACACMADCANELETEPARAETSIPWPRRPAPRQCELLSMLARDVLPRPESGVILSHLPTRKASRRRCRWCSHDRSALHQHPSRPRTAVLSGRRWRWRRRPVGLVA